MFSPIPHGWPVTSVITASGYFFSMFSLFLRLDSFKPSIINFFAKTLNNVELDLREKFIAIPESTTLYTCHTIWNINVSERTASLKSCFPNTCHTIRNIDANERIAFVKSQFPNTCDGLRYDIARFFRSVCNENSFILIK